MGKFIYLETVITHQNDVEFVYEFSAIGSSYQLQ
jgi:hypothetical protein